MLKKLSKVGGKKSRVKVLYCGGGTQESETFGTGRRDVLNIKARAHGVVDAASGTLHAVAETNHRQDGDPQSKRKAKNNTETFRFSFTLSTRYLQARIPIWSAEQVGQGCRLQLQLSSKRCLSHRRKRSASLPQDVFCRLSAGLTLRQKGLKRAGPPFKSGRPAQLRGGPCCNSYALAEERI